MVSRYLLIPSLYPSLLDCNVASRIGLGTSYGLKLYYLYHQTCKTKYGKYYILKMDIASFFATIDHQRLKEKLQRKIKDKEAIEIIEKIIDSYQSKIKTEREEIKENKIGIGIGNMTSQIFAIYYLNDLDHYIKEVLKIKYYIRYQDDACLFHPSKEYLEQCLKKIKAFLEKEKLELNAKTRMYTSEENMLFLGRNRKGKYHKKKESKKKITIRKKQYEKGECSLNSMATSIICLRQLQKRIK